MTKRTLETPDHIRTISQSREWFAKQKATEQQWYLVDEAIKAFIKHYPTVWMSFQKDLKVQRSKYNEAWEGDLKKAEFRNVMAIPSEILAVVRKIIPELTHKKSVNFSEFLKRYPCFRPGEASNEKTY